jgi:hypothetical protein
MAVSAYRVAIVADPKCGEQLRALAEHMHVWAADTPINRAAAAQLWAATTSPSIERGVTVFRVNRDQSPDAWVAEILDTVELHHGEHSHDPLMTVLEIHGASLSPRLRSALASAGFTRVVMERGAIVASVPPAV